MSATEQGAKFSQRAFVSRATSELNLRRSRLALFGSGWASDTWWDLMLILYTSESTADTDHYALAGRVGQSFELAERWLTLLIDYGYVCQVGAHPSNHLRANMLTDAGRAKVEQCLGAAEYSSQPSA